MVIDINTVFFFLIYIGRHVNEYYVVLVRHFKKKSSTFKPTGLNYLW